MNEYPSVSFTREPPGFIGQLAGTPSVLFDAVAIVLSDEGAKELSLESAAVDFVRDAFGHLKAIAADQGAEATDAGLTLSKHDE
jgi:hypothetical protein